ncbi:hypothetical protein [Vulcanisaeta distributa]|uniref:Uncharacterized protein n=1 Tax=Vulcanisaeta distributa (strain DSM 14429 / JCM 11212 / NBRC 100878 / IC-017) TaxID=572478 RepID=E1QP83_VULDI|nr:hypothetical protein [Vulcanisaeta distributa]ADN50254.1 hypothetical protein Vdis_0863 [Vulcanisaeta distributa DSM 14429]
MTIGIKVLSPRYGLTRMGMFRVSLYLGIAMINAIGRLGRFERVDSYVWDHEPGNKVGEVNINLLTTSLDNVDVKGVIDKVREGGAVRITRGFRAVIGGELSNADVSVFLTVYPSRDLSEALGFDGGPNVTLSVFGYVDGYRIESFMSLIRLVNKPEELLRGLVDNFMAYMNYGVNVRTALGFPVTRPLARFVDWVRISNGEDFRNITHSLPIYYSRLYRQLANDLYRHPGIRREVIRLGGNAGIRAVLSGALQHLLGLLSRRAELRFMDRARGIQLSSEYVMKNLAAMTKSGRIKRLGMFIIPRASSTPIDNLNRLINELVNALNKSFEEAASIDHITKALMGKRVLTWDDLIKEATSKFIENIGQMQ